MSFTRFKSKLRTFLFRELLNHGTLWLLFCALEILLLTYLLLQARRATIIAMRSSLPRRQSGWCDHHSPRIGEICFHNMWIYITVFCRHCEKYSLSVASCEVYLTTVIHYPLHINLSTTTFVYQIRSVCMRSDINELDFLKFIKNAKIQIKWKTIQIWKYNERTATLWPKWNTFP